MDKLERQVEVLTSENMEYLKRIESLEDLNATLTTQVSKLQAFVKTLKKNQENFQKMLFKENKFFFLRLIVKMRPLSKNKEYS